MAEVSLRLGLDNSDFLSKINASQAAMNGLTQAASMIGVGLSFAGLAAAAEHVLENNQQIVRYSKSLGMSIEDTYRLSAVSKQTGVDIDQLGHSMMMVAAASRSMDPSKLEAFERLGVSMRTLRTASPEELLFAIADGFANSSDRAQATADVVELLHKHALKLIPVLAEGGDALRKMFADAPALAAREAEELERVRKQLDGIKSAAMVAGAGMLDTVLHPVRALKQLPAAITADLTDYEAKQYYKRGDYAEGERLHATAKRIRKEELGISDEDVKDDGKKTGGPAVKTEEELGDLSKTGKDIQKVMGDISKIGRQPAERIAELTDKFDRLRDSTAQLDPYSQKHANIMLEMVNVYKERAELIDRVVKAQEKEAEQEEKKKHKEAETKEEERSRLETDVSKSEREFTFSKLSDADKLVDLKAEEFMLEAAIRQLPDNSKGELEARKDLLSVKKQIDALNKESKPEKGVDKEMLQWDALLKRHDRGGAGFEGRALGGLGTGWATGLHKEFVGGAMHTMAGSGFRTNDPRFLGATSVAPKQDMLLNYNLQTAQNTRQMLVELRRLNPKQGATAN